MKKIEINIPETLYDKIKSDHSFTEEQEMFLLEVLIQTIKNGTPLT